MSLRLSPDWRSSLLLHALAFHALMAITIWLAVDCASAEPFAVFRARDAYVYLGLHTRMSKT